MGRFYLYLAYKIGQLAGWRALGQLPINKPSKAQINSSKDFSFFIPK